MRLKRSILLVFMLLAGAVAGAFVASLCAGSPGFGWLAFSRSIGLSPDAPFILDLNIFKVSFSLVFDISIAQVLLIGLAIFIYSIIVKRK